MTTGEEDDPVGAWLVEVGLEDFAPTFKREGFEGVACLNELQGLTAQQLVALAASLEPATAARSPDRRAAPSAAAAPSVAPAAQSSARKER
eukprot:COSAG02_NODE_28962_length_578_cov_6.022157_1_plen_90_part_01